MCASGHGEPRNDPEWLFGMAGRAREQTAPGLCLCLQGPVQRLRLQPGAAPASPVLQFVRLKAYGWHNAAAGTMAGMWPSPLISSACMQLSAQASSCFVLWGAAAGPWIGQAGSQLLGEGRRGGCRTFCSHLISGEMPPPKPHRPDGSKTFPHSCLPWSSFASLPFRDKSKCKYIYFRTVLNFLTAKATWQHWRIPTSCKELGNSSIVFTFHCLLVYKKVVTKLFSIKASKALDVVRQWISCYFSNNYFALHEQWI